MDMIEMHVGEERVIALPSMATAGYVWNFEVNGDAAVLTVTLGPSPGSPLRQQASRPQTGSYPEQAVIRARVQGHVMVHLTLARPWEIPAAPAQSRDIDVVVHA